MGRYCQDKRYMCMLRGTRRHAPRAWIPTARMASWRNVCSRWESKGEWITQCWITLVLGVRPSSQMNAQNVCTLRSTISSQSNAIVHARCSQRNMISSTFDTSTYYVQEHARKWVIDEHARPSVSCLYLPGISARG